MDIYLEELGEIVGQILSEQEEVFVSSDYGKKKYDPYEILYAEGFAGASARAHLDDLIYRFQWMWDRYVGKDGHHDIKIFADAFKTFMNDRLPENKCSDIVWELFGRKTDFRAKKVEYGEFHNLYTATIELNYTDRSYIASHQDELKEKIDYINTNFPKFIDRLKSDLETAKELVGEQD